MQRAIFRDGASPGGPAKVLRGWQVIVPVAFVIGLWGPALPAQEVGKGLFEPWMLGQVEEEGMEEESFLDTIDFNGAVDISYVYNWNATTNPTVGGLQGLGGENPIRVFDRFHNEFTLQNAIMNVRREATSDRIFGFGFTPAFGVDGQVTAGGGLEFGAGDLGDGNLDVLGNSDLDVLEAYASFYVPEDIPILQGTTFKVGKFFTIFGGEVIPSYLNTMFSRSFLFGTQPFTHTGVLGEKPLITEEDGREVVGLALGYVNGWDNLRDTNDTHTLLASASLSPMPGFVGTANWSFGALDRAGVAGGGPGILSHLFGLVAEADMGDLMEEAGPLDGLSLAANLNYYWDQNEAGVVVPGPDLPAGSVDYYGFTGLVRYDFANPFGAEAAEKEFYLAMRGEFFDDTDGFLSAVGGGPASPFQLWDLTWTLGYQPTEFVLMRFEVRYDKADANFFDDGSRSHQTTMAVNTVFMF